MGDFGMAEEPKQADKNAQGNEQKSISSPFIGTTIAVAILLFLGFLIWVQPSTPTEKKDSVQAVGVLLAALVGLGGLYFTSQNLKQTRKNNDEQLRQARESTDKQLRQARESTDKQLQQARESQEQTQRLTEQGQITERFTRAIDQLGSASLEIRLGGIYALERIASESNKDHWPIMEILTAYVREHAPRKSEASSEEAEEGHPHGAEIQAILTVIRRRTRSLYDGELERLDLRRTNLREANLQFAKLQEANLSGADLRKADLRGARLTGLNIKGADLRQAILSAHLSAAVLFGADLREADLAPAELSEADLREADLRGANLRQAVLFGAELQEADLSGAILSIADLREVNLQDAKVTDEQLADTRSLQGATMPDGQTLRGDETTNGPTFEDWLKSKAPEEDAENE